MVGKTVRIPLNPPIKGHKGQVREIVLREPTFEEYLRLGDPYIFVPVAGGTAFPSESAEVISQYIDILVVEPERLLLAQCGFKVAREIKEAVLGFFLPDAAESGDSPISPTTSPSEASGSTPSQISDGSKSPS
jgi:hypothetical protein